MCSFFLYPYRCFQSILSISLNTQSSFHIPLLCMDTNVFSVAFLALLYYLIFPFLSSLFPFSADLAISKSRMIIAKNYHSRELLLQSQIEVHAYGYLFPFLLGFCSLSLGSLHCCVSMAVDFLGAPSCKIRPCFVNLVYGFYFDYIILAINFSLWPTYHFFWMRSPPDVLVVLAHAKPLICSDIKYSSHQLLFQKLLIKSNTKD